METTLKGSDLVLCCGEDAANASRPRLEWLA